MLKKIIAAVVLTAACSNIYAAETPTASDYFARSVIVGDSVIEDYSLFSRVHRDSPSAGMLFLGIKNYAAYHALDMGYKNHPVYKGAQRNIFDVIPETGRDKVFLFFGMNDLSNVGLEATMRYYDKVVDGIYAKKPDARIYVIGLTYMTRAAENRFYNNNNYRIYNLRLKERCCRWDAEYIDMGMKLVDSSGYLKEELSTDKLMHLKYSAYEVWTNVISEHFEADIKAAADRPVPETTTAETTQTETTTQQTQTTSETTTKATQATTEKTTQKPVETTEKKPAETTETTTKETGTEIQT